MAVALFLSFLAVLTEKVFRDMGSRQKESVPEQPMVWELSGRYLGKTDLAVDGGVCAVTTGSP